MTLGSSVDGARRYCDSAVSTYLRRVILESVGDGTVACAVGTQASDVSMPPSLWPSRGTDAGLRRRKMLADRVGLVVGDHRNTRFVGFSAADHLCGNGAQQ